MSIKAAFLDRDGTIIVEQNYLNDPALVKLLPTSAAAMLRLREKGFLLFIVSNQSGVARGFISPQQLEAVHREFEKRLNAAGVTIDGAFYCVHDPKVEKCPCRKPATGMVPREWKGQPIDFAKSLVAGDKRMDLELGKNLGARSFLVTKSGYGEKTRTELAAEPDHGFLLVDDLAAVAAQA